MEGRTFGVWFEPIFTRLFHYSNSKPFLLIIHDWRLTSCFANGQEVVLGVPRSLSLELNSKFWGAPKLEPSSKLPWSWHRFSLHAGPKSLSCFRTPPIYHSLWRRPPWNNVFGVAKIGTMSKTFTELKPLGQFHFNDPWSESYFSPFLIFVQVWIH